MQRHWEAARPTVTDVGQVLRDDHNRNPIPSWEEVKPYIDCVFSLANPQALATAGDGFKQEQ